MAVQATNKLNVLFSQIRLPKGFNVRGDELPEEERKQIERSFDKHGLIHDCSVEEHQEEYGEAGKTRTVYLVTEGFGRMGTLLHKWAEAGKPKDWTVTVTVVTYTSRLDPFMRNLAENMHRRKVLQADLAKRLWEMRNGLLKDPKGGFVEKKPTVKELAESLGLSKVFIRELVRGWDKAVPELRDAWRAEKVRADHVRAWCSMPDDAQRLRLEAHLRGEEQALGKANGKASAKGEAGEGEEEEEDRSEVKPRKKDEGEAKAPTRSEILARAEKLGADLDSGDYKGAALEARRAAHNALRWAAGELRSLRLS